MGGSGKEEDLSSILLISKVFSIYFQRKVDEKEDLPHLRGLIYLDFDQLCGSISKDVSAWKASHE